MTLDLEKELDKLDKSLLVRMIKRLDKHDKDESSLRETLIKMLEK